MAKEIIPRLELGLDIGDRNFFLVIAMAKLMALPSV